MIDAAKAREIALSIRNTKVQAELDRIELAISNASKQSKTTCNVSTFLTFEQRVIVEAEVRKLGYQIKFDAGYYDQRENSSNDYFIISW